MIQDIDEINVNLSDNNSIDISIDNDNSISVSEAAPTDISQIMHNEEIRQENEAQRIANEEAREDYITDLKQRVLDGEFNGEDGYSPTATVSKTDSTATITITDKNGTTTAQISDGQDGQDGVDGQDGYSPSASVTKSGSVATITITDKSGTTTANIYDGTGSGGIWGSITGTLSDQTDLQNALNDKQNLIDSNNKLSSDLIDDTDSLNKFVTSTDITNWNNKSDFSGSYTDLTNKPTIPDELADLSDDSTHRVVTDTEKSTWNGKQDVIDSSHKLSADLVDDTSSTNKFFSGNYNDLTNKPIIPSNTSDLTNDSGFIDNTVNNLTNYTLSSSLSSVATSGSYSDLSNKPTIPTKTSDLNNDSNFISTSATSGLIKNDGSIDTTSYSTFSGSYTDLTDKPSLSAVATSGSYSDLSNKPTIPTVNTSKTTSDTATYSCTYINNQLTDSGWVDLSSYVNTTYFKVRTGFAPKVRKVGNTVYFTGYVYCKSSVGSNVGKILNAIPSAYRPTAGEMAGGGCRFSTNNSYSIWIENGEIKVAEANNITTQNDYQGYYLGNLGPYLVN